MNSDPTGYFTLFQMSVAISVQNRLRNTYNSAILNGFVGFLDALLGGERDPMALLSIFVEGVNTGFITGAIFGGISAMANMGCKLAKISVMLKIGMAGFGVVGGAISTVQSFQQGKNAQGALRGVITAVGTVGFAKTLGSSVATSKSCERGKYSTFGEMSEADGIRYRDWNYERIYEMSIHNPNASSMTLGKYFDGTIESGSYVARAKSTGDTYFSLGTQWDDIRDAYGLTDKDMFNLFNTRALDDAVAQGKTIRFSQNPMDWIGTALGDEWNYLKNNHGYTDLLQKGGYWYGIK